MKQRPKRGALALVLLLALPVPALPHDHWINTERIVDPVSGEWCCNEHDCEMLAVDGVKIVDGGFFIVDTGETIPAARVAWRSPDGRWWRCRYQWGDKTGQTRCLIGPPPGS